MYNFFLFTQSKVLMSLVHSMVPYWKKLKLGQQRAAEPDKTVTGPLSLGTYARQLLPGCTLPLMYQTQLKFIVMGQIRAGFYSHGKQVLLVQKFVSSAWSLAHQEFIIKCYKAGLFEISKQVCQESWQACSESSKQARLFLNSKLDRHADRQTDGRTDRQTDRQRDRQSDLLKLLAGA